MLNANIHKNFTASGDAEAEKLLVQTLASLEEDLNRTGLSVYLGGSYGRGDGGVREDKGNGILYNDLDFFVFARKKPDNAEAILKAAAEKYEKFLKVDVDFSRIMDVDDIKNNAGRLMMQELKRGYRLVTGEDLLKEYLPEIPAEKLPFQEACRLLLNRGMGLLLAAERMMAKPEDKDFILRNINKAVLGACDAFLIAEKKYKWSIAGRLTEINGSGLSADCKNLYARAVGFKKSPNREIAQDLKTLWFSARDVFRVCMRAACGENIYMKCREENEISLKNYIKYCIKSRTMPLLDWKIYTMPAVAVLADVVLTRLNESPLNTVSGSKLYQQWLIFN